MKILYSHFGREGKDGWGRSFYMAKAMANLGHEVVFLTNRPETSFLLAKKKNLHKVRVISFPDFLPAKLKSSGFGFVSIIGKLFFAATHKFDLVIADCGHRPTGLPCKLNRKIYGSTYLTEWWDFFGEGGYYDKKPFWFKLLYGRREKRNEIQDKLSADGVIVLSEQMKERAIEINVKNVIVVHGGCLIDEIKPTSVSTKSDTKINFCYIGMANSEIIELDPILSALTNKVVREKVRLVAYGSAIKAEYIEKYNLEGVIDERGWIDYLKDAEKLDDIDIFIQIRRDNIVSRAGWPNKLGDYMANGKPIIISPYGDLVDFVNKNPDGFITVKYDSQSILEKIKDILSMKYDLKQMGKRNREVAEKNSWESKAAQIIKFKSTVYE